jgi:hypothetical protein
MPGRSALRPYKKRIVKDHAAVKLPPPFSVVLPPERYALLILLNVLLNPFIPTFNAGVQY